MVSELSRSCERCERPFDTADRRLTMTTEAGTRIAFECDCGAVTVSVVRQSEANRRS